MKKLTALLLVTMLAISSMALVAQGETVSLTMGSWRSDDAEMVQTLLDKYQELSGVAIKFEPTQSSQYNATLRLQLDNGTGPDLFYSRSYAVGQELFDAGFAMDCTDIPGVKENFPASALDAWQTPEGKIFAVPFAAVSQVVYYNKAMFAENNLEVPQTFEEFLAVCEALKENGIEPLSNGIADDWDILECVYLGMLPNYVGGAENRALYESGEKKMNDEVFVKSLEDFAALAKYLPMGFESIGNSDGPAMMGNERSAMFIDGSWTCGVWDKDYPDLEWGTFAIPAPEGNQPGICFHPDMGITGNNATKYPQEVKDFLTWLASPEGAQITSTYLPLGFFPMIDAPITFEDENVTEILALNEGKVMDARFVWAKLLDLYVPMVEQLNAIARGETTPQAAADVFAAEQAKIIAK
ncbi:MAG: carbohydrate ABC transporter substrate-binding protein [Clostridiales bacterium]|nr:carbohydrate ABC transporter substrate-binding protein [Clostridiales bacterium]